MGKIILGIFIILHGLVHLFYFGHSFRMFELTPDFIWPDGGWAFTKLLGVESNRKLAGILLVAATIPFVIGGIGIFIGQSWWQPVVVGSAAFSALIFVLFWDGSTQMITEKGLIAILINLALLVMLLVFKWPNFEG